MIILVIIIITSFFAFEVGNKSLTHGSIIPITQNEVKDKFRNKDSFIIVITKDNCKYCYEWDQMIDEYLKTHNVDIYDLNIDKNKIVNDEEINTLFPSYVGTPNIFCVKNGEIVSQYDNMNGTLNEELFNKWVHKYSMEK